MISLSDARSVRKCLWLYSVRYGQPERCIWLVYISTRVQVQFYDHMCTQMTTNRIGNLTWLVYTLLCVMTMHAYIVL